MIDLRPRKVNLFLSMEKGGGERLGRVQTTLVREVPGPGVSIVGGGEKTWATYKSIPAEDTLNSRGSSGFDCECITETSLSGPREGEKSQHRYIQESVDGNLFSIRTAGKLSTRGFVS